MTTHRPILAATLAFAAAGLLAASAAEPAYAQQANSLTVTCTSGTTAQWTSVNNAAGPWLQPGSRSDFPVDIHDLPVQSQHITGLTANQQYTLLMVFNDGQSIYTSFTCTPSTKTTITMSDFTAEAYSYVILDPAVTLANDQAPTTYRGYCNTADNITPANRDGLVMDWMSGGFKPGPDYLWARSFSALQHPPGTAFTCWAEVTNGGTTARTPDITVTLTDPGTGSAPTPSTPSTPSSTPSSPAQTSTPSRTGGGSGGSSGGSGLSGFIPVSSAPSSTTPAEPEQPTPYQPTISNGTISNVKLVSVPLNTTHWNGTIQTPLQCNATSAGHFNITRIEYAGMEPYDIRVMNDTHANATDTTPATYNVTVSTVSTYDISGMEPFGALLGIRGGGIDWLINNQALAMFQDIFGTVDMREVRQHGNVTWAAADGSCYAP